MISRGDIARLSELTAAIRIAELVERIAREDPALDEPGAIKQALARKIRLSETLANGAETPQREPRAREDAPAEPDPRVNDLQERLDSLDHAIRVLAAVPVEDYAPVAPIGRAEVSTAEMRDG